MRATVGLSALAAACALGGCSAIVDGPGDPRLACDSRADTHHCPEGQDCVDGFCQDPTEQCANAPDGGTGAEELCNGIDDDCDGDVDEGHDLDEDGFTWCGSGDRSRQDCDDNDPSAFPAADGEPGGREMCDGQNNDCDGDVDEDPPDGSICPEGQQCFPREGGCIVADCSITGCEPPLSCDFTTGECTEGDPPCRNDSDCADDAACDVDTGICVEQQPLGTPCMVDTECENGVCMAAQALRLPMEGKVCGRACCTEAECPEPGMVCWVSGTGARSCLPDTLVDTKEGTGAAGAACSEGSECMSGVCGADGCISACADPGQCSAQVCRTVDFDRAGEEISQFACLPMNGRGGFGDRCTSRSDCRSGLCLESDLYDLSGERVYYCSEPCGTGADCPPSPFTTLFEELQTFCGHVSFTAPEPKEYLPACIIAFGDPNGRTGDACDSNSDCFDRACIGGACADTCCSDGQCDGETRCRPFHGSQVWAMRCLP